MGTHHHVLKYYNKDETKLYYDGKLLKEYPWYKRWMIKLKELIFKKEKVLIYPPFSTQQIDQYFFRYTTLKKTENKE